VRLLRDLGYRDVSHYAGGLAEWTDRHPVSPPESPHRRLDAPVAPRPRGRQTDWIVHVLDRLSDRSVGQLFAIWIEIVLAFAAAYWLLDALPGQALLTGGAPFHEDLRGAVAALYFSAVTATSVGYGDIVPSGVTRLFAIAEAAAGLLIFGCVISKFVSRRQEELIGEIHRIAFEDRLGRVRTNLHLVRTELQATARLCEGHDIPPPAALARIESIAMVFVGELRTVHDLLYRPQQAVEEPVLEAILASLASVFREFGELVACVDANGAATGRSPALRVSLGAMDRLAAGICGDCVPRAYAPALRGWMDQIQELSRRLTAA
jgi:hypothetical protein